MASRYVHAILRFRIVLIVDGHLAGMSLAKYREQHPRRPDVEVRGRHITRDMRCLDVRVVPHPGTLASQAPGVAPKTTPCWESFFVSNRPTIVEPGEYRRRGSTAPEATATRARSQRLTRRACRANSLRRAPSVQLPPRRYSVS